MPIEDRDRFSPDADLSDLIGLRRSLIRLQDETRLLRRHLLQRKYSPAQPRVPAGNTGGGRWTSGESGGGPRGGFGFGLGDGQGEPGEAGPDGGTVYDTSGDEAWTSYSEGFSDDGSLFERDVVNRDGSTIRSEYDASRSAGFDERQTVTLNSGERFTFETTGREQTIRYGGTDGEVVARSIWTPSGPERDATVQPALAPMAAAPALIIGGAILYGWQSPFNGSDGQQAVMGFEARKYTPSAPGAFDLSLSARVSQDEATAACKYLPKMQEWLDDEVRKAGPMGAYSSETAYGTQVHKRLEERIKSGPFRDLYAERSFLKEAAEGQLSGADRGQSGAVRIDALEYRPDGTVCVYDFKTGRLGDVALVHPRAGRVRQQADPEPSHRDGSPPEQAMTTKRQIKRLLRPVLERHPELFVIESKFEGVNVMLAPIDHMVRGLAIRRSGIGDLPEHKWFFSYSFRARAPLTQFGGVPFYAHDFQEAKWSHPRHQDAFVEVIEDTILPLLSSINTVERMLTLRHPNSLLWDRGLQEHMTRIFINSALGRFDLVDQAARELKALGYRETYFWSEKTYREAMEELWPLTQANDHDGVAALLHDWERQFVELHGLQDIYEKKPFPFQLAAP
jgi:hypothetical protein